MTLDVDVPVPGPHTQRDVGHRPPAALLRLKPPGVVSLRVEFKSVEFNLIKINLIKIMSRDPSCEREDFNYLFIFL